FAFHAVLFSFLLVATFIDYDHLIIPLPLTIVGSVIGLIGAVAWPWPWPYQPREAAVQNSNWIQSVIPQGLYPWPVWGPLPDWLAPGSIGLGFATGLAGLVMGTLALRVVRVCLGLGMGPEFMDEAVPNKTPRTALGRAIA